MRNVQDGISLVQTVEGALTEVHTMLNRMKGMAVQAANGTYTESERAMLNSEMEELKAEITRIGESTTFSGVPLFTNGGIKRNVTLTSYYGCTLDLSRGEVHVNYSGSVGRAAGRSAASGGYEQLAEAIATDKGRAGRGSAAVSFSVSGGPVRALQGCCGDTGSPASGQRAAVCWKMSGMRRRSRAGGRRFPDCLPEVRDLTGCPGYGTLGLDICNRRYTVKGNRGTILSPCRSFHRRMSGLDDYVTYRFAKAFNASFFIMIS